MSKNSGKLLFNLIAPIYGLFYNKQKKHYTKVLAGVKDEVDLTSYETILDVGCGTGALCAVLSEKGLKVTGIDPAEKMLAIARKKPENKTVQFINANVLEKLPFENSFFDISIASYVAHGLQEHERIKMYAEMSRVTSFKVIIYDYNQQQSLWINIAEWLEGGDYFHFIRNAEYEMNNCVHELQQCFSEVRVINVSPRAAWYICTPS